jgi:hypothetical protein
MLVGVWSSPTSHRRIAAMFLVLTLVTLVVLSSLEAAAIGYLVARRLGYSESVCDRASMFSGGAGGYAGALVGERVGRKVGLMLGVKWGAKVGAVGGGLLGAGIGALVGGL